MMIIYETAPKIFLPQRTQSKHKGRKYRLILFFVKNLCVLCG